MALRSVAGRWWHQPDHYAWLTEYLRARSMMVSARVLLASATAALAAATAALILSGEGPRGTMMVVIGWAAVAAAFGCSAVWMATWPSKRQSLAFILMLNSCIAAVCQIQSHQAIGVLSASAFAVTGGYIACFHTARYMLYNVAVATYIAGLQTVRYALEGDVVAAVAALLFVQTLNVGVPFGIQAMMQTLGGDAVRADTDPLTRLLTRRALFRRVPTLLAAAVDERKRLRITVIDLDRFKHLNDTAGHAVGDQALIAVGRVLAAVTAPAALVGRIGGEEFLIAELTTRDGPDARSQRVCDALAHTPYPVTASLGTATASIDDAALADPRSFVDQLCIAADAAMYRAKRSGGNRVCHHEPAPCGGVPEATTRTPPSFTAQPD